MKNGIALLLLCVTHGVVAQDWSLTGNSGTNPTTNFIGTTDNVPLQLRVYNQPAGRIERSTGAAAGVTYLGYQAGANNVTEFSSGLYNTGIGAAALNANTFGVSNTALGFGALALNSTANNNTAVGHDALGQNDTGSNNSALGFSAMLTNLSGDNNTVMGYFALSTSRAGSNATAIGVSAMSYTNSTSTAFVNRNVAVGYEALRGSTTASANTGNGNTALGYQTLLPNSTGSNNLACGEAALGTSTTGSNNSASGYKSLRINTTGSGNTGCGYYALSSNITGSNNTGIGRSANVSGSGLTNATALGYSTSVSASNKVRLGNSSITVVEGQVYYTTPSDARFKREVKDDVQGLSLILKLRPVSYTFDRAAFAKHIQEDTEGREGELAAASQLRTVGFLAQEVEKTVQDLRFTEFDAVHAPENPTDNYGLAYAQFVVPLVKAVQELHAENAALLERIEQLENKLDPSTPTALQVYPIPTDDAINVMVEGSSAGLPGTFEFFDAGGRQVHQFTTGSLPAVLTIPLPSDLVAGAYLLILRVEGQAPRSARVVVGR